MTEKDIVERLRHGISGPHKMGAKFNISVTLTPETVQEAADEIERLRDCADSVLFHQTSCMGGCHASMYELARLAKMIGYKTVPPVQEEFDAALAAGHEDAEPWECFADNWKQRAEAAEAVVEVSKVILKDLIGYPMEVLAEALEAHDKAIKWKP